MSENSKGAGGQAMTRYLAACVAVAAYVAMWVCAVWEAMP